MAATEAVTASGLATADLGGTARTSDVTRAVCERIREEVAARAPPAWRGEARGAVAA